MTKDYRIMDRRTGTLLPDDHLSDEDKRAIDPYTRRPTAQAPKTGWLSRFKGTLDEADQELEAMGNEVSDSIRRFTGRNH
jgi:hypothetical protein